MFYPLFLKAPLKVSDQKLYIVEALFDSMFIFPCLSLPLFRLAGYVEALASRLGMQIPDLSPKQADMWQTRVSSHSVGYLL